MNKWLLACLMAASLQGEEMISVRKSEARGRGQLDWLSSYFTFSFSEYYDPAFMGFRTLKVLNEDFIEPSGGFPTHPHKDMEILTYVLDEVIEHKDTLGNHSQIKKGEFQLMTAGKGVKHSEFNPSSKEKVHLLQIWIEPEKKGLEPGYQQKQFAGMKNGLKKVVSPDGSEGSLKIHQDAKVYLGVLEKGNEASLQLDPGRSGWVQAARGDLEVNGVLLKQGDGASVKEEQMLHFKAKADTAEFLVFDLK